MTATDPKARNPRARNPRVLIYAHLKDINRWSRTMTGLWDGPRHGDVAKGWPLLPSEEQPENNVHDLERLAEYMTAIARTATDIAAFARQRAATIKAAQPGA